MDSKDTFKIMIASDGHLGCFSNDPVRGKDSFDSFEETLRKSSAADVDFLLLGGDLFHHCRPSQQNVIQCLGILRKHCLGDKKHGFEVLSDQEVNFNEKSANFKNPNCKISLPIFSIHGNHDAPSGIENLSAMDLISKANFINYFGKTKDISKIIVRPILLQKGKTNIALYGLGSIKDERLHRLFLDKKVTFSRPVKSDKEWFNILVLHQNRYKHSYSQLNYIPESFLPSFMHLVIWGHEHECIMEVQNTSTFKVIQPGSTVRTSLSKNEVPTKHIGLLKICGMEFNLSPLKLETVRPFLLKEIELKDFFSDEEKKEEIELDQIESILTKIVEEMIEKVANELNLTEEELFMKENLPSIRLRVEHDGFEVLNPQRFGKKFVGKVSNPLDILLFFKKSKGPKEIRKPTDRSSQTASNLGEIPNLILKKIHENKNKPCLLAENGFLECLKKFVEKTEYGAIDEFVEKSVNYARKKLEESEDVSFESKKNLEERMREIIEERATEIELENSIAEKRKLKEKDRIGEGAERKRKRVKGVHSKSG